MPPNVQLKIAGSSVDGRKTVTASGTAEALGTGPCLWLIIIAETNNTAIIAVGASTVVAAEATRRGIPLNAGDSTTLTVDNLSKVYLDTTVNGDGVTFVYGKVV